MKNVSTTNRQNPSKPNNRWILIVILIPLLIFFLFVLKGIVKDIAQLKQEKFQEAEKTVDEEPPIDPDNPSKFIQTDFVELDKVYSISKFRSGMGHDYSYLSGETCRSMKHYFSTYDDKQPNYKYEGLSIENFPTPTLENDVKIFTPVDGFLDFDDSGVSYNQELRVAPSAYPNISIEFQHVQRAPNVNKGKVKAGELIGLVLANQSFDLAIQTDIIEQGVKKIGYISYFAAMPDNVFTKYQARGVKNRGDLIITRKYRDTHPLNCRSDQGFFAKDYLSVDGRPAHIFDLTGFKEMDAKMQVKYPNPNIVKSKDTENQ
ncbi:MAG TPA: hypothetical protein VI819_03315 [Patescibacteria group bacterium]|nr:hypothetical protein [Patescibacteria group bacterium]